MLEGRNDVNGLKRSLELAREVIRERQTTNPNETYHLGFSIQLASPRRNVSSSQMLSELEKLQSALQKFAGDEEFLVKILFGVSAPAHDEFINEVAKRDQLAAELSLPKQKLELSKP